MTPERMEEIRREFAMGLIAKWHYSDLPSLVRR